MRSRRAIKFKGKTREVNRNYEQNNNNNMDNGVYNDVDSEEKDSEFVSKNDDDLDLDDAEIDKNIEESERKREKGEKTEIEKFQEEALMFDTEEEFRIKPSNISKWKYSLKDMLLLGF